MRLPCVNKIDNGEHRQKDSPGQNTSRHRTSSRNACRINLTNRTYRQERIDHENSNSNICAYGTSRIGGDAGELQSRRRREARQRRGSRTGPGCRHADRTKGKVKLRYAWEVHNGHNFDPGCADVPLTYGHFRQGRQEDVHVGERRHPSRPSLCSGYRCFGNNSWNLAGANAFDRDVYRRFVTSITEQFLEQDLAVMPSKIAANSRSVNSGKARRHSPL